MEENLFYIASDTNISSHNISTFHNGNVASDIRICDKQYKVKPFNINLMSVILEMVANNCIQTTNL